MTVQDDTATSTATHGATLTDAAAAKAKALLDQEGRDDLALRIAVQPGGCAGLRYNLFFDDRSLREAGLHHRQPERHRILRLRRLVQLIQY